MTSQNVYRVVFATALIAMISVLMIPTTATAFVNLCKVDFVNGGCKDNGCDQNGPYPGYLKCKRVQSLCNCIEAE